MKRRNLHFGCVRIAQQISHAFGIEIDKDVVRRVLAKHFRPEQGANGPSWLTFIGHLKDSLWSADLFRVESILLRSHWVLLVMDVFTRRIIGFGVHDEPASDDWIQSTSERNVADDQLHGCIAVRVRIEIAKVPGMTHRLIWQGMFMTKRVVMVSRALSVL
jgi:hypothetical protein